MGARWLRYAFTREDVGKTIVATLSTGSIYQLSVDGIVRTETSAFIPSQATAPYTICAVEETSGGEMQIGSGCATAALTNPPVAFTAAPAGITYIYRIIATTFCARGDHSNLWRCRRDVSIGGGRRATGIQAPGACTVY